MPHRTLIATMGFDERHVLPALRLMPYDRLVVVGGRETFRSAGFLRLRHLEPSLRAVAVPSFDLLGSFAAIRRAIVAESRDGPVRLSVSGGTKILTSAAILAAFQEGVEAWYCDPDPVHLPVHLPVLQGLRIGDAFTGPERVIAMRVRNSIALERLVTTMARQTMARRTTVGAVKSLAAKGLFVIEVHGSRSFVRPSDRLPVFAAHLREESGKA